MFTKWNMVYSHPLFFQKIGGVGREAETFYKRLAAGEVNLHSQFATQPADKKLCDCKRQTTFGQEVD